MIPLWIYPLLAVIALWVVAWRDERNVRRKLDNFRAVEAERIARRNAHPLGNADRYWDEAA